MQPVVYGITLCCLFISNSLLQQALLLMRSVCVIYLFIYLFGCFIRKLFFQIPTPPTIMQPIF